LGIKTLGRHLVVEMYGVQSSLLHDLSLAKRVLRESIEACRATFMGEHYTVFAGGGISG